jgi:hypothetical protein
VKHRQDRLRTPRSQQSSKREAAAFGPLRTQTATPGLARSPVPLAHDFGRIPMHPADRVVKEELEADLVAGLATTLPARTPFAGASQIQPSSEAPDRRWDVAPPNIERPFPAPAGRWKRVSSAIWKNA